MNLPAYMTSPECHRWLLWQSEPQEQGKPRKIPYYVNGRRRQGVLDSPKDLGQLVSFDEAQSIVSSHRGRSGLAFALGADHNDGYWQGIDLDAIDVKPELLNLKLSLPGYVEISPSQNGLHAIGYGRKFKTLGSNKSGIEAYCMARYFTVTGNNTDFPFTTDLIDIADFVEQYLRPLHSQAKTVDIKPLTVSTINTTVDKNGKLIDELGSALRYISADDYAEWIAVGQALKGLENDGFVLWSGWSASSPKFKGDADLARWKTFTGDQTGYAAVFAKAQRHGWINPGTQSNQIPTFKNESKPKSAESPDLGWTTMSIDDLYSNPSEPPRFIIDSLLPYGVVTLLAAHGGTGKSMLALQAAVCMAMGQAFMGKETIPGKVIFFSAEDATPTVRYRLECICRDKNIDPVRLAERLCIIDSTNNPTLYITQQREAIFTAGYDALRKLSTAYDADCIIIDNASDTFDANENERARVRAFIRFLTQFAREQNAAILLLAHIDKDTAKFGSGESYSGSTAWHNSVRSRLFLSLEKDTQLLSLAQQKSNFGTLASTINMRRGKHGILYLFSIPSAKESGVIILSLIEKYYALSIFISTAPTSPSNPYKILSKDSDFPQITKKQLADVLQEMVVKKELLKEKYGTKNRKAKERYKSARTAPSAPSIDIQVCADDTNSSPCSAPTTTGGMGEEITQTEDVLT